MSVIGELSVQLGITEDKNSFARAAADIKRLGDEARKALSINWGGTGSPFGTRAKFNPAVAHAQAMSQAIRTKVAAASGSAINWAKSTGSPFGGGAAGGGKGGAAKGGFFSRMLGAMPNTPGGGKGVVGGLTQFRRQANLASRAFTGLAAFAAGRQLVQLGDTYTNLQNRLLVFAGSQEKANALFERLRALAINTRAPLEQTTETFVRVSNATSTMGISQEDTFKFVERLNQAMAVSGASASEMKSGLMQMTQALAKGKLDGDEFKSIAENMPNVLKILQDSLGVTEGQLRKMSKAGTLTRESIVKAFLHANTLGQQFAKTTPTMASKFQAFSDTMMVAFGKFAQNVDLVNALEKALNLLADVLILVMNVITPVVGFIKDFAAGLKDGKVWAWALAIVIGSLLIPKLISLLFWLGGIPRALYVLGMFKFTSLLLGIEKVKNGFIAAAAAARGLAVASGGSSAAGGVGALGALGAYAAPIAATYALSQDWGPTDKIAKGLHTVTGGVLGSNDGPRASTDPTKNPNMMAHLKQAGLTMENASAMQRLTAGYSDEQLASWARKGDKTAQSMIGGGGGVTQNITINGVTDANQIPPAIGAATNEAMERSLRHAGSAAGGGI